MINFKNTIAIIYARSGSKSIKNKNLKKISGKSLILHSINYFKLLGFKEYFVSSDSNIILKEGMKHGAIPIKRPKSLSSDSSNELDAWKHSIKKLLLKNSNYKYLFTLPCTSPIRSIKTLKKAMYVMNKKKPDLVVSITKSNKSPDFNMLKRNSKTGYLNIYNKRSTNIFRRQDADPIFILNTNFYIADINFILRTKKILDGNVLGVETPKFESIDIDDIDDFKLNEIIYKSVYE